MSKSKADTKRLTRTTRDIGKMLYQSTLQEDQQRLLDNYRDNHYLQESKKALDKINEKEKDYQDSFNGSFKNTVREKIIEKTLDLILPGILVDNLIADLGSEQIENYLEKKEQERAYNEYYDAVIDGLALSQEIGSSIRNEDLYYHIGIGNSKNISVFELDLETMHKFEQNKDIFEIGQTKSGKFYFGTKQGLSGEDIIDGLMKANATDLTTEKGELMQDLWKELRSDTGLTYASGRQVRPGDRFEIFESNIIDAYMETNYYQNDLEAAKKSYKHDSTSGYAAGDRVFELDGQEKGYGIQSKFFNIENSEDKRRFNVTSIDSLKEVLTIYSDKKMMEKLVEEEREKAEAENERTGEVPKDIATDTQQAEEEVYDQAEEVAEEEAMDWISENW